MTIETLIMAGLIFLPIIGSVIGYIIGQYDAQKLYRSMIDEEINRCKKLVRGKQDESDN